MSVDIEDLGRLARSLKNDGIWSMTVSTRDIIEMIEALEVQHELDELTGNLDRDWDGLMLVITRKRMTFEKLDFP